MQQLSAKDAVFLAMETAETPSHVGGLALLDATASPDFDHARFVEMLESRIALCPRFMWTVQEVPLGLDRPYWVERDDVAPRDLVHRIAVPSPGGTRELADLAGLLFARPLGRDRPLWEMFYIEGLQGGRVALLWKVHHCLIDGASGAGLAELLFDLQPEPGPRPLVPVEDVARAGRPASLVEMLGGALRNGVQRPIDGVRHASRAALHAFDLAGALARGASGSVLAPRASFNGANGPRRTVAWSQVPLEDVKAVKNALGVKLNDVVLAITGGAVRRHLEERDELPVQSLVASVPVSTRKDGDRQLGNQLAEINVYWGTDVADPIARVHAIHAAANAAKEGVRSGRAIDLVGVLSETMVPGAVQWLMRTARNASSAMPLPANAVVSNVQMTPVPLYIAGARVAGVVPISLLAPTQGLNITAISYDGGLHFGITADPDLLPDPWSIAGAIPKALIELQEALAGAEKLSA